MAWCQAAEVMPFGAHAVAMGGHVGICLGDHSYGAGVHDTNASLVARVAELGRLIGRPLATQAFTRRLLGLTDGSFAH